MPMLTLHRFVKKHWYVVIREFISAYEGVLDDDCIGFIIHNAIMQMSINGFTCMWLAMLHRTDHREPPHCGPTPHRAQASLVATFLRFRLEWRRHRSPICTHKDFARSMGTSPVCCATSESSIPQSSMLVTPSLRPPPTHQLQHRQKRRGLDEGHRHQRPILVGNLPWRLGRDAHRSYPTTWSIARRLLPMSSPALLPPHRHSRDAQDCVPSRTRSNYPTTVATTNCCPLTRRSITSPKLARKRGRTGARARARSWCARAWCNNTTGGWAHARGWWSDSRWHDRGPMCPCVEVYAPLVEGRHTCA